MENIQDRIRDVEAKHSDKKIIIIQSVTPITILFVIWLILSLFSIFFLDNFFGYDEQATPYVLFGLFFLFSIPIILWNYLEYKNLIYYLTESELIIKKGVISMQRYVIPFGKIQDVHVTKNLLERILNVASLRVETASTGLITDERLIPAVSNYRSFVNELFQKVEKARRRIPPENPKSDYLKDLLREIKELKTAIEDLKQDKVGKNED